MNIDKFNSILYVAMLQIFHRNKNPHTLKSPKWIGFWDFPNMWAGYFNFLDLLVDVYRHSNDVFTPKFHFLRHKDFPGKKFTYQNVTLNLRRILSFGLTPTANKNVNDSTVSIIFSTYIHYNFEFYSFLNTQKNHDIVNALPFINLSFILLYVFKK